MRHTLLICEWVEIFCCTLFDLVVKRGCREGIFLVLHQELLLTLSDPCPYRRLQTRIRSLSFGDISWALTFYLILKTVFYFQPKFKPLKRSDFVFICYLYYWRKQILLSTCLLHLFKGIMERYHLLEIRVNFFLFFSLYLSAPAEKWVFNSSYILGNNTDVRILVVKWNISIGIFKMLSSKFHCRKQCSNSVGAHNR